MAAFRYNNTVLESLYRIDGSLLSWISGLNNYESPGLSNFLDLTELYDYWELMETSSETVDRDIVGN